MNARYFYEFGLVVDTHRNYDLLSKKPLCCYIDFWLWVITTIDNLVNVINFVCLKLGEYFFDFQNVTSFWQ